jgi:hypothetical protein
MLKPSGSLCYPLLTKFLQNTKPSVEDEWWLKYCGISKHKPWVTLWHWGGDGSQKTPCAMQVTNFCNYDPFSCPVQWMNMNIHPM